MLELVIGVRFRVRVWVMIMIWGLYLRYGLELYGLCVRKGGSTVLTVRVRYIIKAPLVLMGLSN